MTTERALIPTLRLNTLALPVDRQFEAWASFTPNSRVTRPGSGAYAVEAVFWHLDRMIVSVQTADAFTMDRDAHFLETTAADHFLIVLPYDGESRFTAPGIDALCRADDVIVANLNRLGRCENVTRQRTIAVSLSRAFLEEATGPADAHGPLTPTPETRLFVSFMRALVEQLPATAAASVSPLSRIVRDLFANAVAAAPYADSPAEALALGARARAYAQQQQPGSLDIDAMTAALATTRSTLFRLFKADGGVLTWDRRRRLRLVHRAVADPLDHRTLAQIGFDHGFVAARAPVPSELRLFDEHAARPARCVRVGARRRRAQRRRSLPRDGARPRLTRAEPWHWRTSG